MQDTYTLPPARYSRDAVDAYGVYSRDSEGRAIPTPFAVEMLERTLLGSSADILTMPNGEPFHIEGISTAIKDGALDLTLQGKSRVEERGWDAKEVGATVKLSLSLGPLGADTKVSGRPADLAPFYPEWDTSGDKAIAMHERNVAAVAREVNATFGYWAQKELRDLQQVAIEADTIALHYKRLGDGTSVNASLQERAALARAEQAIENLFPAAAPAARQIREAWEKASEAAQETAGDSWETFSAAREKRLAGIRALQSLYAGIAQNARHSLGLAQLQNELSRFDVAHLLPPEHGIARTRENAATSVEVGVSFTTAKGSRYIVHGDGTTTRTKAARPEHPGDVGPQERSLRTLYVDRDGLNKLGESQARGGPRAEIAEVRAGLWGIRYLEGNQAGKVEPRTVTAAYTKPAVGLFPVEIWKNSTHFGNEITAVDGLELLPPPQKAPTSIARETIEAVLYQHDAMRSQVLADASTRTRVLGESDKLLRALAGPDITAVPLRVAAREYIVGKSDRVLFEKRLAEHSVAVARTPQRAKGHGIER